MEQPIEKILDRATWKSYGAVTTPGPVVDLMIGLAGVTRWRGLDILEPGSGLCDFLGRIREQHPENNFTAVEVNREIMELAHARHDGLKMVHADFLSWEPAQKFDLVMGNPPYGIIGDQSHYPIHTAKSQKDFYRSRFQTWHGKYNIYGAFVEKAISLLKPRGKMVFIVPATFMVLDDFKLLRRFLAVSGRTSIYYLGPKVFEKRQVSTAVLVLEKGGQGMALNEITPGTAPRKCFERGKYDGAMIRFESGEARAFAHGKVALGDLFEIHFAARSPQVANHPLTRSSPGKGLVPVLTDRNLRPGRIDYKNCSSNFYFPLKSASALRDFYGTVHIVVGHTKAGAVVAAIDYKKFPWREEIHLVPKSPGIDLEAVTEYLNSEGVQKYMKRLYRDITPHLTISQLKILPIGQK